MQFLYPDQPTPTLEINHIDMHLLRREAIRSASLYVADFGADDFKTDNDSQYRSRDGMKQSEGALRAVRIASRVINQHQSLEAPGSSELLTLVRDFLAGAKGTIVSVRRPAAYEIQYDSRWVDRPDETLPDLWCQLHYGFGHSAEGINRFQIATWLASFAYSEKNVQQITPVLYALSSIPTIAAIELPEIETYM